MLFQRLSPFGTRQFPDRAEFPPGSLNTRAPGRDGARGVPRDAVGTSRPSQRLLAPSVPHPRDAGCVLHSSLGPARRKNLIVLSKRIVIGVGHATVQHLKLSLRVNVRLISRYMFIYL